MEDLFDDKSNMPYCKACSKELTGRTDKKFCNNKCKASFNNRKKNEEEAYLQSINRILRKNRNILKQLYEDGHTTTRLEALQHMGFDFGFYTNQLVLKSIPHNFCYEWGYTRDYFGVVRVFTNEDLETIQ